MGEDFVDAYLSARTMRATEDVANELRKMRQGTVSMEKYNQLVREYNCDTSRFLAQRDEAMSIIKENIDSLPFEYDDARMRVNQKGDEAFKAESLKIS